MTYGANKGRKPLAGLGRGITGHGPIQPSHVHPYLLIQAVVSGAYIVLLLCVRCSTDKCAGQVGQGQYKVTGKY